VRHYPVMKLKDICALRVDKLAANDAHLWLWITNSNFFEAMDVMDAWGFSYRSCLTWIKASVRARNLSPQPDRALVARHTRQGTNPVPIPRELVLRPVQSHSHKPEEQYAIIEHCSPGRTSNCSPVGASWVGTYGATR
jgi:N6-adenosine-specific RNA methylase IME4